MRDKVYDLVKQGANLLMLLESLPHSKKKTNYYGFIVDKYTFNDTTVVLVLWDTLI